MTNGPEVRALRPTLSSLLVFVVAVVLIAAGCGSTDTPGTQTVLVEGAGNGRGTIQGAGINCELPKNPASPSDCEEAFEGQPGGGSFELTAHRGAESWFVGWSSGCSRIEARGHIEVSCLVDYSALADDITHTVTAKFDTMRTGDGGGGGDTLNTVRLSNASPPSAYLVGPGERPGAGNLVFTLRSRYVKISTRVGSQAEFRAFNSTRTLLKSITCRVTADAWQNGTRPQVVFAYSSILEEKRLACLDGLVPVGS